MCCAASCALHSAATSRACQTQVSCRGIARDSAQGTGIEMVGRLAKDWLHLPGSTCTTNFVSLQCNLASPTDVTFLFFCDYSCAIMNYVLLVFGKSALSTARKMRVAFAAAAASQGVPMTIALTIVSMEKIWRRDTG